MIDSVGIYRKANSLVQLHGTRDTIKLAEASGVEVVPVDCFNSLMCTVGNTVQCFSTTEWTNT